MTRLGIEVALNIATLWLLAEAYLQPPRGFHGPPWFVLGSYIITCGVIVLLAVNFTFWLHYLWRGNG